MDIKVYCKNHVSHSYHLEPTSITMENINPNMVKIYGKIIDKITKDIFICIDVECIPDKYKACLTKLKDEPFWIAGYE